MPSQQATNPMEMPESRGGPLARLPVVYAVAIALQEAGVSMASIADRLGLPHESMATLLEIASAKLAAARQQPADSGDESRPVLNGRILQVNQEGE